MGGKISKKGQYFNIKGTMKVSNMLHHHFCYAMYEPETVRVNILLEQTPTFTNPSICPHATILMEPYPRWPATIYWHTKLLITIKKEIATALSQNLIEWDKKSLTLQIHQS